MEENQRALVPIDFSKRAVQKEVVKKIAVHPALIYSASIGIGGLIATLISPTLHSLFLLLGGFSVALGSVVVNYFFRSGYFEANYIKRLHEFMAEEKSDTIAELGRELKNSKQMSGLENFANQANEQFRIVEGKFEILHDLLNKKLIRGELTYVRYAGTAEQVCFSLLDQLKLVTGLMKSADSIDEKYISSKLKELSRKPKKENDQREVGTLTERKILKDNLIGKIDSIISQNETALTEIDKAIAMIAEMKLDKGKEITDLESSRKQLEELIGRANKESDTKFLVIGV